jgi:large subunit ribosomal protein L31e
MEEEAEDEKEEESAETAEDNETEISETEETVSDEETPSTPEEEGIPLTPEEEEVKPTPRKKKEEEEIVEERIYTIPLGKAWIAPPNKRTARAMRMIKSFITKHMKLEPRRTWEEEGEGESRELVISNEVNERVWRRGVEKPPRKIRVRAAEDKEGKVTVYLAEGD